MRDELRLLAIAGPPIVEPARMVESCRAAEDGGVTAVQLRLKGGPAAATLDLARELAERLTVPLWVNDRADIALAIGARGVHVGADDLPPTAVRAFAGERLRIGVSVGDVREAQRARIEGADYWSVGAVYTTRTKADAGEPIGPVGFRSLADMAPQDIPTIAIGGITEENVAAVLEAGAVGVAVSHAIFGASDIRRAAQQLRVLVDAHRSS